MTIAQIRSSLRTILETPNLNQLKEPSPDINIKIHNLAALVHSTEVEDSDLNHQEAVHRNIAHSINNIKKRPSFKDIYYLVEIENNIDKDFNKTLNQLLENNNIPLLIFKLIKFLNFLTNNHSSEQTLLKNIQTIIIQLSYNLGHEIATTYSKIFSPEISSLIIQLKTLTNEAKQGQYYEKLKMLSIKIGGALLNPSSTSDTFFQNLTTLTVGHAKSFNALSNKQDPNTLVEFFNTICSRITNDIPSVNQYYAATNDVDTSKNSFARAQVFLKNMIVGLSEDEVEEAYLEDLYKGIVQAVYIIDFFIDLVIKNKTQLALSYLNPQQDETNKNIDIDSNHGHERRASAQRARGIGKCQLLHSHTNPDNPDRNNHNNNRHCTPSNLQLVYGNSGSRGAHPVSGLSILNNNNPGRGQPSPPPSNPKK